MTTSGVVAVYTREEHQASRARHKSPSPEKRVHRHVGAPGMSMIPPVSTLLCTGLSSLDPWGVEITMNMMW